MHSLRGAFSETDYIYGFGVRSALALGAPPSQTSVGHSGARILSVGLGLGYCEVLSVALMLQAGVSDFYFESFEVDARLRESFRAWISAGFVEPSFAKVYEQTLSSAIAQTGVSAELIRASLSRIVFREDLRNDTSFDSGFSCILFDAFSSKSSPQLWTQEFLEDFLSKAASEQCVFVTYACTGILKRALRACHFKVEVRPGYASKRDSTFALKVPIAAVD